MDKLNESAILIWKDFIKQHQNAILYKNKDESERCLNIILGMELCLALYGVDLEYIKNKKRDVINNFWDDSKLREK